MTIQISIAGKAKTGKTTVAAVIIDALRNLGIEPFYYNRQKDEDLEQKLQLTPAQITAALKDVKIEINEILVRMPYEPGV